MISLSKFFYNDVANVVIYLIPIVIVGLLFWLLRNLPSERRVQAIIGRILLSIFAPISIYMAFTFVLTTPLLYSLNPADYKILGWMIGVPIGAFFSILALLVSGTAGFQYATTMKLRILFAVLFLSFIIPTLVYIAKYCC